MASSLHICRLLWIARMAEFCILQFAYFHETSSLDSLSSATWSEGAAKRSQSCLVCPNNPKSIPKAKILKKKHNHERMKTWKANMFARKWPVSKLQQIAVGSGNFPQFFVSKRYKFDKREAVRMNTIFLVIPMNELVFLLELVVQNQHRQSPGSFRWFLRYILWRPLASNKTCNVVYT